MNKTIFLKYGRWVITVCGLAALMALLIFLHHTPLPNDVLEIKQIDFSTHQAETLPPADVTWTQISLPDDWQRLNHTERDGWYRITLTLNVPPNRLWGIYLPSAMMNPAVFLNNELLGSGGRFTDPVARNWNRPLYFSIPNGLLKSGENTLFIHIKADPARDGMLSHVFIGPEESLTPAYEYRLLVRYGLSQIVIVMLFVTSVLMFLLWYRRRADTVYLWFGLTTLVWAIHTLNLIVINIPMSTRQWNWLNATITWLPIFGALFIRRLLGYPAARIERFFIILGVLASGLLAVIPEAIFNREGVQLNGYLTLLLGVYSVAFSLRHFVEFKNHDVFLLSVAGIWMMMLGAHDTLIVAHIIDREHGVFMHYSAPPILFVFVSILLKRFVDALNETEKLNLELASRIKLKHLELEDNHHKMRALEHQHLLTEERERILRDMHDGMGGHLVSTLALVDNGVADCSILRGSLQQALDDLRLMIDSMEDVGGDVLTVLGMLRQRLEPRLTQAGIIFHWQVQNIPPISDFGPQKALHVMRILQEGITNIIKHAQAHTITLRTGQAQDAKDTAGVFIQLCDDGLGFFVENKFPGRGLQNMQRRAALIGGQFTIQSNANGSCLHLWLPLQ
jgi:signal transduction histidine kinase